MSVYLDASVLVALLRPEAASAQAREFVSACEGTIFVSDFGRGEVGATVSRLVRMGEIQADLGRRMLADFDEWLAATADLVATFDSDVRLAAQFVRRFDLQLRMPDAIHLAAAQALDARIATYDRGMAKAASSMGIKLAIAE